MDSDDSLVVAGRRGSLRRERAKLSRTMDLERDSGGLELISKAGAVLDILEQHKEASAADLAAALGEPLSSVYRLLQSLTTTGWVDRGSRRGAYRLGLSLMTIGGLVEDHLDIRDASLPSLRELVDATKADKLFMRSARSACSLSRTDRGLRGPVSGHAAGRFVAALRRRGAPGLVGILTRRRTERDLEGHQPATARRPPRPDDKDIIADIARIRAAGYSVSDGDVTPGIAALGAPVFNHRGEVQGALSLSGLRGQVLNPAGVDDTIELLRLAAGKASAALGWEVS